MLTYGSHKSAPCVNENDSISICSSGNKIYFLELKTCYIFWINSEVKRVLQIQGGGGGGGVGVCRQRV